jgi:hypothetical protein
MIRAWVPFGMIASGLLAGLAVGAFRSPIAFEPQAVYRPEDAAYTPNAAAGIGFVDMETPRLLANGTLALSYWPSPQQSLLLFKNGAVMVGNVDFTSAGNIIRLRVQAQASDRFVVWYRYWVKAVTVSGLPGAPGPVGPAGPAGPAGGSGGGSTITTGASGALDCVDFGPGVCDVVTAVVPLKASANVFTGVNQFTQLQVSLFTVATLPACNAASEGQLEGVSDALNPVPYQPIVGGGAVHVPVYCNGVAWVAH